MEFSVKRLNVNDSGLLTHPDLHDGFLKGIVVGSQNTAYVLLNDRQGAEFNLVLSGVEKLRAQDFREGNIILDVSVYNSSQIDDRELCELYDLGAEGASQNFLNSLKARIVENDSVLVQINPSYGCSLLALCRNVTVKGITEGAMAK